jgi:hypothetical protein
MYFVFGLGVGGGGDVDWIGLAQDSDSMKCWETIEWPNI